MRFISKAIKYYFILRFIAILFVSLEYLTFLRNKFLILLFIHSGSRGRNVLTSFGTKLDMMFNMVWFKIETWRLGLKFERLATHGKSRIAFLIDASLARLKCQIFLVKLGGAGILKLIFVKMILCFTVLSSEDPSKEDPMLRRLWAAHTIYSPDCFTHIVLTTRPRYTQVRIHTKVLWISQLDHHICSNPVIHRLKHESL